MTKTENAFSVLAWTAFGCGPFGSAVLEIPLFSGAHLLGMRVTDLRSCCRYGQTIAIPTLAIDRRTRNDRERSKGILVYKVPFIGNPTPLYAQPKLLTVPPPIAWVGPGFLAFKLLDAVDGIEGANARAADRIGLIAGCLELLRLELKELQGRG